MRRPFVYLAIPMIMGIIFHYFIETSILIPICILILVMGIIVLKKDNFLDINLPILFFVLGILILNFKFRESQLIEYIDKPIELKAVVEDVKISSEGESSYVLKANRLEHEGMNKKVSEKLSLKVYGKKQLQLGDEIVLKGVLKEPLANTNPGLYNHRLNLLTQNIYTTANVNDYSITLLEGTKPSIGIEIKKNFVDKVEGIFDEYLEEDNSFLMKSIVLGRSSYLDEEKVAQFRDLGLAHILAVSGLHIGIISGFLVILFAYMGLNRKLNIPLVISMLWVYAYIIGNPPSVIRANIMFSLLLISQIGAEPYDSMNTLFFALFLMLIINPFWIFSLGFQLSFVATFFIIYLTPRIKEKFYPYKGGFINTVSGILSVQIGLFPIQAYYFNRFPIMGLVSNIVLIPLISIALVLGIILIPVSFISVYIAESLGIVINSLLNIQFYILDLLSSFHLILKLPSPSFWGILIFYIVIAILLRIIDIRNLDNRIVKTMIFYCLFLILLNSLMLNLDKKLEIDFIDVGQGDCILLNTRDGSYLIDTGGNMFGKFDIGERILLPYLEKNGIFKLKGVFISHFHGDHCKSLPYLMDNMKVENIYIGYKGDGNEFYEEIVEKALEKNVPIKLVKKGEKFQLDSSTNLFVLGPDEKLLRSSIYDDNDLSMVLLLNYYDKKVLFTGDIEKAGEESLLESLKIPVDFLKVPHHGSNTSSTIEFLEKTRPMAGFVSVGRNNRFDHPNDDIIERYEENGIELYRTDELGFINVCLNKKNHSITPFIKKRLSIIYVLELYGLQIIYLIFNIIISYIMIGYFTLWTEEWEKFELQGIY